tara:strand:- start:1298 stop:2221 length:924 start_codon:yes stop_codon:yes gene_type:complete
MQIKKPSFWQDINLFSILLYPASLITSLVNLLKNLGDKEKFNIKSICVGNIYLGGTGKTPLSIKIKEILNHKFKIVFIKKKYINQSDEQNLLKKRGKLICTQSRSVGLKKAISQKFDLAILDDGLQEKGIKHDLTIACFNTSEKIGNGLLIPAGPLREKLSNLKYYDAVFLNGVKKDSKFIKTIKKFNKNINIFEGKYKILNLKNLNRKKKYLIFSGIGTPEEFEKTLKQNKFNFNKHLIFPDHYDFSFDDIEKIRETAKQKGWGILTTEKDYLRLKKKYKKDINYVKIDLNIKNLKTFSKFLNSKI